MGAALTSVETINALSQAVVALSVILTAINAIVMLSIRLEISKMQTRIEQYRREDINEIRRWVEEKMKEMMQQLQGEGGRYHRE